MLDYKPILLEKKDEEIINEIQSQYPELMKDVNSLVCAEKEVRSKLSKIIFDKSGEEVLTTQEVAILEGISESAVRYRLKEYDVRPTNNSYLIRLASVRKITEVLNKLKSGFKYV